MERHDEAERLFRQALEIAAKTIGAEHPNYVGGLNNLANLLRDMGRYDEAERLFRQALEIGKKTIGAGHPNYAVLLNNLANLLRD
ncbi:MAG: tetratricopeptide repeat protein, partial [Limibaculum sp.]